MADRSRRPAGKSTSKMKDPTSHADPPPTGVKPETGKRRAEVKPLLMGCDLDGKFCLWAKEADGTKRPATPEEVAAALRESDQIHSRYRRTIFDVQRAICFDPDWRPPIDSSWYPEYAAWAAGRLPSYHPSRAELWLSALEDFRKTYGVSAAKRAEEPTAGSQQANAPATSSNSPANKGKLKPTTIKVETLANQGVTVDAILGRVPDAGSAANVRQIISRGKKAGRVNRDTP